MNLTKILPHTPKEIAKTAIFLVSIIAIEWIVEMMFFGISGYTFAITFLSTHGVYYALSAIGIVLTMQLCHKQWCRVHTTITFILGGFHLLIHVFAPLSVLIDHLDTHDHASHGISVNEIVMLLGAVVVIFFSIRGVKNALDALWKKIGW